MVDKTWMIAKTTMACVLAATGLLWLPSGLAQQVPARVCAPSDKWFECSKKVQTAIKATNDLNVALAAASEWAARYDALYRANAQKSWPWSDQEMLQMAIEKLYDEALGKYLDPASIAFGLALAKYLPRLAATLEFAGSASFSGFLMLLAPSPIANEFTEAGPDNKKINALLTSKMPPTTLLTIEQRYPELFRRGYAEVQASKKRLIKP